MVSSALNYSPTPPRHLYESTILLRPLSRRRESSASSTSSLARGVAKVTPMADAQRGKQHANERPSYFQMPLHYPRFTKPDYEMMPEWKLNCLLREYGLPVTGDLDYKRKFAMGAFLWPSH